MKFLIVGRTATGKDALQNILVNKYGWKPVKSFTTRPQRSPDEDTHIFISERQARKIPRSAKAAWTCINGYEYFATDWQVQDCDVYIIDPRGAMMLLENMPDEQFCIVYLYAANNAMQKEKALERSDDSEKEKEIFKSRSESEDEQFSDFEDKIKSGKIPYDNCVKVLQFTNYYNPEELERLADTMESIRKTGT